MTTDSQHVLAEMYAAEARYLMAGGPGRASFAPLAPFFSPDVVLPQADGLPYGGTWRGHEGMERFFVAMSQTWESFDLVEQRFLGTGDTAVVLITVRDGRISEIRPFYWETAEIARTCTSR